MKYKTSLYEKFTLLCLWIFLPAIITLLTVLGFNIIFYYYAPNGRHATFPIAKLSESPTLVTASEIWDRVKIQQPFVATTNGLAGIDVQAVTFLNRQRPDDVFWQLNEITNNQEKILRGQGKFHADEVDDWDFISLKFEPLVDSSCKHYEISFSAAGTPQGKSIGFPIFKTNDAMSPIYFPKITSVVLEKAELTKLKQPLDYREALALFGKTRISQTFTTKENGLTSLQFQMVTWHNRQKPHVISWKLYELRGNDKVLQREGVFDSTSVKDWVSNSINFTPIENSIDKNYELVFTAPTQLEKNESVGFPLYEASDINSSFTYVQIADQRLSNSKLSIYLVGIYKLDKTQVYPSGSLNASLHYFYEKFNLPNQ